MRRAFKYLIEFVAAVVAIAVVLGVLAIWRLSSQPVSSTYLTPYVQSGIGYLLPNATSEIGSTLLVWDNSDNTIALQGEKVKLRDVSGNVIASLPSLKIKFSVLALLWGRLIPAELNIERPQLKFERRADGSFVFGGTKTEDVVEGSSQNSVEDTNEAAKQLLEELARDGFLSEITIDDAQITVSDAINNRDWILNIPSIRLMPDRAGLVGQAHIDMQNDGRKIALRADYRFNRNDKSHSASVRFNDFNPAFFFAGAQNGMSAAGMIDIPLTGDAGITLDNQFKVVAASLHINGKEGRLLVPDFWDEPRGVKSVVINANYDPTTHKLQVTNADIDFGGPKLGMKIDGGSPTDGGDFDVAFVMDVQLSNLPMDQFASVWPKPVAPGARDWIMASMSKGVFDRGDMKINGKFKWNDIANMVLVSGEGKASAKNGTVTYIEGVPPAEGVSADAHITLDGMEINLIGGGSGNLKILPSLVKLTDFQKSVQYADIPVKLAGPVKDVIKIIDSPPLGYAKAVGLKAEDVDGKMEGIIEIKLPLLKDIALKDVGINAEAKFADFAAKNLVPKTEITQGALALNLDANGFEVKGPAAFNKVPLNVEWKGAFAPKAGEPRYQATLTGNVTGEQFALLGIDSFKKPQGATAVKINYKQPTAELSQLSGELDFAKAGFLFDKLNWTKAVGTPASLTFSADIPSGKDIQIKDVSLQGNQVKIKGSATVDGKTGQVSSMEMKPFVIGRSNAVIKISKANNVTNVSVDGDALDISGLDSSSNEDEKQITNYVLKLNKLYMSDTGFISNVSARAKRDKIGWEEIDLHGMADGERQLYISLLPQLGDPNKRAFNIKCDNFGKLLSGLGFTDTVRNGPVFITGISSADNPRAIEGDVNIGSFSVSGLPVLMRLLSAASPFGFADLVTGSSSFDHLQGKFRWYGDEIELKDVRAAGSVYGVNVDGKIKMNGGDANLHGTLVPFSFFNKIVNSIPLLGDIITGGEGEGVIAASYSITGKLDDPEIGVNPVSLLTPGFLRNLFFSGDDDGPAPGAIVPEKAPANAATIKNTATNSTAINNTATGAKNNYNKQKK